MYSGKTMERITHGEDSWKDTKANSLPNELSNELMSKEAIKKYFSEVAEKYDLGSVRGIRTDCGLGNVYMER